MQSLWNCKGQIVREIDALGGYRELFRQNCNPVQDAEQI
jgi:hypothetical protein